MEREERHEADRWTERWHADDDADRRIEALYHYAHEVLGRDNFVDAVVQKEYGPGASEDATDELAIVLKTLESLCGSAAAGVKCLFYGQAYTSIAGADPYDVLELGDFWT